jgi:PAS domain S-box-containing protein
MHRRNPLSHEATIRHMLGSQLPDSANNDQKHDQAAANRVGMLLQALNDVQNQFILDMDCPGIFDRLLNTLVSLTESEFGYLAEVVYGHDGRMRFRSRAISPIAPSEEMASFLDRCVSANRFAFKPDNLWGAVISGEKPVISNDSANDSQSGGVPSGHPRLRTFFGLPLHAGKRLVGIAGVANRPNGYDEEMVAFLQPYLATCAAIIAAHQSEERRRKAERALAESEARFRDLAELLPEIVYELDAYGRVVFLNRNGLESVGCQVMDLARGTDIRGFIIRGHHDRLNRNIRRVLAGEIIRPQEYLARRRDGTLLPVLSYSSPIWRDGKAVGIRGVCFDISERKRAEEQIRSSLEEKEVLLREIHHRVKNNLQVVSSLLCLQSGYAKDEEHEIMFQEAANRVRCMALVHEMIYQSENLAEVRAPDYVGALTDFLVSAVSLMPSRVRLHKEIQDIGLGIDTAFPLGLIVTELVSNSLKHAFPEGRAGWIRVSLRAINDRECEIVVADDGVGLKGPVNWDNPGSLGLDLVDSFVKQLEGDIDVSRDRGTEVRIRFRDWGLHGKRKRALRPSEEAVDKELLP